MSMPKPAKGDKRAKKATDGNLELQMAIWRWRWSNVDGNLELHEFLTVVVMLAFQLLTVVVMLAFQRANPRFGEVGYTDAASVANPFPGCLEALLRKSLLPSAKRDGVASIKAAIHDDPDVQVALWSYKVNLAKRWKPHAKCDSLTRDIVMAHDEIELSSAVDEARGGAPPRDIVMAHDVVRKDPPKGLKMSVGFAIR
eukprot:jgi/Chrpa1/5210/Chrysochromulina_OHIO_Genome00013349-RA